MRKSPRIAFFAAVCLLLPGIAWGQETPVDGEKKPATETTPKGEPENPAILESWLDGFSVGALIRIRGESKNNFDFSRSHLTTNAAGFRTQEEAHKEYVGQKTQIGIDKKFSDDIDMKIVLQDARVWGGQPGSRTGFGTGNDNTDEKTDVRAAWVEYKNLLGPVGVRAGRQLFKYGDERLLGSADFSNVGRSFDGFAFKFDSDAFHSHLLTAVLSEKDSDANGNNVRTGSQNSSGFTFRCDPNTLVCTVTAATARELNDMYFAAWYNTWKPSEHFLMDFYYMGVFKTWIQATSPVTGSPADAVITTQDRQRQRDLLHTGGIRLTNRTTKDKKSVTFFDWTLEGAAQWGVTGLTVDATWDPIAQSVQKADIQGRPLTSGGSPVRERIYKEKQVYKSFAAAADAGVTIAEVVRIGGEYDVGSGDKNRTDAVSSTFQNLFPSNHSFYGEADQVSWQNMIARSGNITFNMGKYGKLRAAYWEVDKHRLEDAWYDVGGNRRADALGAGLTTESQANARYANATDASGAVTSRGSGILKKHLFKEWDLVYTLKIRRIEITAGYAQILAGDSVADVRNDVLTPYDRQKPDFNPRAQYAYLQFSANF